jgi:two-component system, OmpR family, sensor histidine kinase KdpD
MSDPERDALDGRPTPEDMLARIGVDATDVRGRLRLYLGMAPGVGKTYRMLEEGHRRLARGTDLVVGFVEAHGRPHTLDLLAGLEVVPRRRLEHRGVRLEEMDTDAVLARRPTVALIDELAHTNIPGSVREKRWQDVEVIRDAGIHVVSTLNVQHLENLADAVETITGAPVHERLPDDVLLGADEIELVDMSPHALRQRMRHGNVYPPERAAVALERFFTEANLTALRELALRLVAEQVEGQLEAGGAGGQLPLVSERVAVLVDGSPASLRAIRRAARLAGALHAAFVAVVVDTPADEGRPFDRGRDLQEAIDDALDLGADLVRLEADDVVSGLEQVVRSGWATHVVLPAHPTGRRERLLERPLAERLMERLPDIELHLVGAAAPGPERRGGT